MGVLWPTVDSLHEGLTRARRRKTDIMWKGHDYELDAIWTLNLRSLFHLSNKRVRIMQISAKAGIHR